MFLITTIDKDKKLRLDGVADTIEDAQKRLHKIYDDRLAKCTKKTIAETMIISDRFYLHVRKQNPIYTQILYADVNEPNTDKYISIYADISRNFMGVIDVLYDKKIATNVFNDFYNWLLKKYNYKDIVKTKKTQTGFTITTSDSNIFEGILIKT